MSPRRIVLVVCLGTVAVLVAFTAPLANINQTVASLGAGHRGATWVLSSMSIGLGAFLLTAGRLADDYGRRRWFVIGAAVLGLSSVMGAVAGDVGTFVASRILAGAGGAAVIAAGLGLIAAAHPDPATAVARPGCGARASAAGSRSDPSSATTSARSTRGATSTWSSACGALHSQWRPAPAPSRGRRDGPASTCRAWC